MSKSNIAKVISIVFILALIFSIPLTVKAEIIDTNDYKPTKTGQDAGALFAYGGTIASAIQLVGSAVSIGTLMVIGIRYMVSSADGKAEYKERMIPYLIGAFLLFGAVTVVGIFYN